MFICSGKGFVFSLLLDFVLSLFGGYVEFVGGGGYAFLHIFYLMARPTHFILRLYGIGHIEEDHSFRSAARDLI